VRQRLLLIEFSKPENRSYIGLQLLEKGELSSPFFISTSVVIFVDKRKFCEYSQRAP